jgi:ubiquinone/menaquinone biosynthesis C-methylase UbiE
MISLIHLIGGDILITHNNLEEYRDPINYDLEFGGEVDKYNFYLELAKLNAGEVLELACGTGLTMIHLAKQGIEITGVDIEPEMLKYARMKAEGLPVTFIDGDARTFESKESFSMIYLTGNAFQAFLSEEDQISLLKTVYKHLKPNGVFAFETRNPLGTDLSDEEETKWGQFIDKDGVLVQVSGTQSYDTANHIMHWVTFRDWGTKKITTRIACRFTDNDTLRTLVNNNGFNIENQYSDWNKTPFSPLAPSIISICRKIG